MDDLLMNLETRLSEIDEEMGSTQDFEKLDELSKERDEVEKTLEEKNERYLELLEIEESEWKEEPIWIPLLLYKEKH